MPTAVAARSSQDFAECRRVISRHPRGLLGDLLKPDDLVRAAAGQVGQSRHVRYVRTDAGVHQPVGYVSGRQKHPGQLDFAELAAALPILLRVNVFR